ncbi:MAG: zinc ribbon domain-containing protein [Thermoguttaceae bacterium]|nr:zinc ribbon domain-containing protein [Thermoguttaceae bacterium]
MAKACLNCKVRMKPNAKFCARCGTSASGEKPTTTVAPTVAAVGATRCSECDKDVVAVAKFCVHCGKKIAQPTPKPTPAPRPSGATTSELPKGLYVGAKSVADAVARNAAKNR